MRYYQIFFPFLNTETRKEALYLFLIVIPSIILYAPVLLNSNGFIWDDPWMIIDNPYIRTLDAENIGKIFTAQYMGQYSPVNTLYYCLVYKVFGLNPFIFHSINILVHIINSILVFIFIYELLEQKANEKLKGRIVDIAFFCALLFSITTVQVEVVAWISASKILLYSFFFLLSLIAYLRYLRYNKRKYFILSHLFYILSIGSKEQAVILPLSLILIDYYVQDKITIRQQLNKSLFFIIAIISGLISLQIQDSGFSLKFVNNYFPFWQRVLLSFYCTFQYAVKILLPLRVGSFYNFPMKPGDPLPPIFLFYVIAGILIIYYLMINRKNKVLIWGVLFFLLNLALSLHIIPLGRETLMADRYCYISTIGIFFIGSYYFIAFLEKFRKIRKLMLVLAALYLIAIFMRSFIYIQSWSRMG